MGKYTISLGEFRPRFSNISPRTSSFYSKSNSPLGFQGLREICLDKEVKAKANK